MGWQPPFPADSALLDAGDLFPGPAETQDPRGRSRGASGLSPAAAPLVRALQDQGGFSPSLDAAAEKRLTCLFILLQAG